MINSILRVLSRYHFALKKPQSGLSKIEASVFQKVCLYISISYSSSVEVLISNTRLPTLQTLMTHRLINSLKVIKKKSRDWIPWSYNKSQRDALFIKFISINKSTCFGQIYCPSSGVSTLYTQQELFVTCGLASITNTFCCVCSVETSDDGQ